MRLKKFSCKATAMAAALAMVLTMLPVGTPSVKAVAASEFTVGDTSGTADIMNVTVGGTATDHGYKITDAEGLKHFADVVNSGVSFKGKTVTLAGDIDLNPGVTLLDANHELIADVSTLYAFPGIGTGNQGFDGTFNGNGYVIKGLYMTTDSSAHTTVDSDAHQRGATGLFNFLDSGVVKNLGVIDSYIKITGTGWGGGIVADTGYCIYKDGEDDTAQVNNCFFVGYVNAEETTGSDAGKWVGGLVGFLGSNKGCPATVTDCYVDAVVRSIATERVGLVVGQSYGTVDRCYATGGGLYSNPATTEHIGIICGRWQDAGDGESHIVKGLVKQANQSYTDKSNKTTDGKFTVYDTAEEVKALITNQCFLSVINGTYVVGKGFPQADGTYSNSYVDNGVGQVALTIADEKFDTLPKVSKNEAEDAGYFGSDSYPAFSDFRIVADPTDPTNNVMAVTANSKRCQLLLTYGVSDLPKNATLSFRFYVPVDSSVGSGMDWNGIVADALQEVERTSPTAKFDQVMYVKAASDDGALAAEVLFEQGKWYDVECNLGEFTDGNIIINFWKSIYNEGSTKKADAFMYKYFKNQDLYIDDFKLTVVVDKATAAANQPDEQREPALPAAAKDGGYDYSWSVDADGIQGLPAIVTDGSATNVTEELMDALYEAINTEGFFKPAKNVILMIGDGMGINPVTASEHWYGELIMNDLPNQGTSMTRSYTSNFSSAFTDKFEDNVDVSEELRITDSSAGGTAIASGYKTYYYSLAVGMDGSELKSLADVKDERGGAVGIITNGWISDATPLVFLGHSMKRGLDDDPVNMAAYGHEPIQAQMFDFAPELLMGVADEYEVIGQQFTDASNAEFIKENDMGIARNWEEYLNLETAHNVLTTDVEFDYNMDTTKYPDYPNMVQVTAKALQQLDAQGGDEGFFVMIEDGEIDMDGHDNNRDGQLQEIQNLDEAVAVAIKFVLEHPDTILLVTADHDTGGMTLKDGWDEYLKKCSYTTGGHSANNIPVYAIGYGTEIFNGQVFQNNYIGRILGNLMGDTGFGDSEKDPMVILDGGKYGNNLVAALVDTGKAVGSYDTAVYTYNVLTTDERDAETEAATTVLFTPPTLDTTEQEAVVVKAGDKLAEPAALVSNVAGYEFAGWYKDEACTVAWDFAKDTVSANGDTVLYAGWKVATGEPKVEEPKTEEPKTEEPKVEEPKTEEPKVEEPKVEEPKADDIKNVTDELVLDVYKIYDAEGLYHFASLTETLFFTGKTVELANDIYLQDEGVVILGADFEPAVDLSTLKVFPGTGDVGFDGTFDGKNHVIYGLYMESSEDQKFGLFGSTDGATIKNVGLVDAYLLGDEAARCRTGLLVGLAANTTVDNCFVIGSVDLSAMGSAEYVGALVGRLDSGSVTNCYGQGNVKIGNQHAGIIVGRNNDAANVVDSCYVTGGTVSNVAESSAIAGVNPATNSATVAGVNSNTADTVMDLAAIKALIKNENYLKAIEMFPEIYTNGTTEEPKVEEPKVEEPKVEEPKVEEPKTEEPTVQAGREVKAGEQVHVVQKGECLWGIAAKYLGDGKKYTELFARNSDILFDAEIVGIGQEIIIPAK